MFRQSSSVTLLRRCAGDLFPKPNVCHLLNCILLIDMRCSRIDRYTANVELKFDRRVEKLNEVIQSVFDMQRSLKVWAKTYPAILKKEKKLNSRQYYNAKGFHGVFWEDLTQSVGRQGCRDEQANAGRELSPFGERHLELLPQGSIEAKQGRLGVRA